MLTNIHAFVQAAAAKQVLAAVIIASDREDQKKALSSLHKTASLSRMQADSFSKEQFLAETEQIDLFASKKVLVIEEAHLLKKEELSLVTKYLERPHTHLTLVLLASDNLSSPKVAQHVKDCGGLVLTLLNEKPWDKKARLVHETMLYLKEEKISIDQKLCEQLIESQGLDQNTLHHELEKVICYIGDRGVVTKEDVQALSTPLFQQTIWNLGDALFQRRASDAIAIGKRLLEEGSLHHLLASLRSQIRSAAEILALYQEEGKAAVTKRYGYLKGTLLDKKIALYEGYGTRALSLASHLFFEADLQLREGGMEESIVLELLLIKLCRC